MRRALSPLDAALLGGASHGASVGFTLITPDAIRARIDVIDTQVDLLDKDISRSKDRLFVERWAEWYTRWKAWKNKVYPDYWLLFVSGTAIDEELTQWQKNLQGWREEFEKKGGQVIGPQPPGPPPSTVPQPIDQTLGQIGNIVIAVAVIGGAVVAIKALS